MTAQNSFGTLFLLPSHLGEPNSNTLFPPYYAEIIEQLHYYIVENARTARRGIKAACPHINLEPLVMYELDKHNPSRDFQMMLQPLFDGKDMAVLSEAGMPCIADPGNTVVAFCHAHAIRVVPVVGPSSILLALIASGGNGQQFTFHGYLPIKEQRKQAILRMEKAQQQSGYSQIFMETPYRNQSLFEELTLLLAPHTKLCIACDISLQTEEIRTKTIADWRRATPSLHKRLCVFVIV